MLLGVGWLYGWVAAAGGIGGATLATTGLHASFLAVNVARLAVLPLGVLVIAHEFATGQILLSLRLCPWRPALLLAKAVVLAGALGVAGLAAGAALIAMDAAHPGPAPSIGAQLLLLLDGALQLVLVGVFALGVAAALRSTSGALSVLYATFLVLPVVAAVSPGLVTVLPNAAANATLDPGAAGGPALLMAWTAAALLAGAAALHLRRP